MSLKKAIYKHLMGQYGVTFTAVAATDVITATGHTLVDGDKVRVSSTGTLPGGLSASTDYFVRDTSGSTFKLAASSGGAAIDITSTGSGTHSMGTTVTDQVGNRIYAGNAAENPTEPYIVYRRISAVRFPHLGGSSGLVRALVQFDICDDNPETVEDVRDALRLWLDGFDKAMGTDNLDVRNVTLEDEADVLLPPEDAGELGTHNTSMDFFITYAESVPAH